MTFVQSNTRRGRIVLNNVTQALGVADRGKVVSLLDNGAGGRDATVQLAAASGALCQYVVDDIGLPTQNNNQAVASGTASAGASGVSILPLFMETDVRVLLSGTCSGGAFLIAASGGQVTAAGTSTGVWILGVAEESGVNGQLVLMRPLIQYRAASEF